MKQILSYLMLALALVFTATSCGKKEENTRESISGTNSKVWKITRGTNPGGSKIPLSAGDKQSRVQFYADGKFTMNSPDNSTNGTWTYDAGAKNLSLQFSGANVSENFAVENLNKEKMSLKAADGSTLSMEAEN